MVLVVMIIVVFLLFLVFVRWLLWLLNSLVVLTMVAAVFTCRFLPTGRSAMTGIPRCLRWEAGPTPDSISSWG